MELPSGAVSYSQFKQYVDTHALTKAEAQEKLGSVLFKSSYDKAQATKFVDAYEGLTVGKAASWLGSKLEGAWGGSAPVDGARQAKKGLEGFKNIGRE